MDKYKINYRKVSIGLFVASIVFTLAALFVCFGNAFKLSFGTALGTTYTASIFTLMFGGTWDSSDFLSSELEVGSNGGLITAFIFMLLVLLIAVLIIYSLVKRKICWQNRIFFGVIATLFLISCGIIACFIKQYTVNAYIKVTSFPNKDYLLKNTRLGAGSYLYIVFIFIAALDVIGSMICSYIHNKDK